MPKFAVSSSIQNSPTEDRSFMGAERTNNSTLIKNNDELRVYKIGARVEKESAPETEINSLIASPRQE